jgi:heme/copper-type cytochrome/quinol oxidase subunit 2
MTQETLHLLAAPLFMLQFLAFGWSVHREINTAKPDRQIVLSLPDVVNLLSMFATVGCLIVVPIATDSHAQLSRIVLGFAYVLIAFHPVAVAAHYRLWSRTTKRSEVGQKPNSWYVNREELAISVFSITIAISFAVYLVMR